MSKTYEVGQVIWVVGSERPGLRVFQVVEEVTKKTLNGEITNYVVAFPSNESKAAKTVGLDKLTGEIFTSESEAKEEMVKNAKSAIDAMFDHSRKLADKFNARSQEIQPEEPEAATVTADDNSELITLENGQVARIKLPDGF